MPPNTVYTILSGVPDRVRERSPIKTISFRQDSNRPSSSRQHFDRAPTIPQDSDNAPASSQDYDETPTTPRLYNFF